MDAQPVMRGRHLGPARLLIGSLIAGAGIAVLGFFVGGNSASAAEPTPPPVPAARALLSAVGSAVSGAVVQPVAAALPQPVAAALPQPVRKAVATVTALVVDVVQDVAAAAPAAQVVMPVARTVDQPVGAVAALTTNVAGTAIGAPIVGDGIFGSAGALSVVNLAGSAPAAGSAPRTPAFPGGRTPDDALASTGTGSCTTGAGAPGPGTAVPSGAFAFAAAARGSGGAATDDRLPVSPVAEHDTSPD